MVGTFAPPLPRRDTVRAPEHPNEARRLEAVAETGLVGELPNELQEAAVRLASEICRTPIAAVSLVDKDRQWFSAIHGLACRETPRDVAFCAHTILQDSPLVIGDATRDPRFADNTLVTSDPSIRFYAGVPLRTLDDPPVGSLCVIDSQPRTMTDGQIESLKTLGGLVASQLEMYRYNRRIRAQAEQHRKLLERLTKIASQVPGVIYQFRSGPDGSSSFPYASDRIREIYRVSPEDVERDASAVFAVLHPEDREAVEASIADSIESLTPWKCEYRVRFEDGTEEWLLGNAVPQREPDGSTLWHGFIQNISDRKQVESTLLESRRIIGEQNVELSRMADRAHRVVDDVSHEFRTPLAVIKEFASIIRDGVAGPVSEDQARYLEIMSGAVVDLNHMVEDLLDSSKLRAGILRVDRKGHSVASVFEAVRPTLAGKAASRSIGIDEQIPADLPWIFADEEKVRRVITNLMTNAIKFSPEGGRIVLGAIVGPRDNEVSISVTDCGPGLSAQEISQIFGRFQQTDTARDTKVKGFGLGLNIAHELAGLNLGRISVLSRKTVGSTFSFTLPVCDIDSILSHYFESLSNIERPGPTLALLRATAEGTADSKELGAFLASITYASDLVLPEDGPGGPEPGGGESACWWVLGCTDSIACWTDRIMAARAQQIGDRPESVGPLVMEVCGAWDLAGGHDDAAIAVQRTIAGREILGTTRSHHR